MHGICRLGMVVSSLIALGCSDSGDVKRLACDYACRHDSDCVDRSEGALDQCVDIGASGTGRCTKACVRSTECSEPYSVCLEGECSCPCRDPSRLGELTCDAVHTSALSCVAASGGSLPACEDVDFDGAGECTSWCHADTDCPSTMVCDLIRGRALGVPPRHGLCVCGALEHACEASADGACETLPCATPEGELGRCATTSAGCACQAETALCGECATDADCAPGLSCLDDDFDAATPAVCTVGCGESERPYACPEDTTCFLAAVEKVCTCRREPLKLQCGYACTADGDCVLASGGQLNRCVDLAPGGTGRCTRDCIGAADCPGPYSSCVDHRCACPCDAEISCATLHVSSLLCGELSGGRLFQCEDADGDGAGECTSWCHADRECPTGMTCDFTRPPAHGWGLCVCEGTVVEDPCGPHNINCAPEPCDDGDPTTVHDRCQPSLVDPLCQCHGDGEATPCPEDVASCGGFCQLPSGTWAGCYVIDNECECSEPPNPCQSCLSDADCFAGLRCIDDDGLIGTPPVCSRPCASDDDCPRDPHGEVVAFCSNQTCVCERCKQPEGECRDTLCSTHPVSGSPQLGVCRLTGNACECVPPAVERCALFADPSAVCAATSNGLNLLDGGGYAFEIPATWAGAVAPWNPALPVWYPEILRCGGNWIWTDGASWDHAFAVPLCARFTAFFRLDGASLPGDACLDLTADDTALAYVNGTLVGDHPAAIGWSGVSSIAVPASLLVSGTNTVSFEVCSTVTQYAGLLYNLLVR